MEAAQADLTPIPVQINALFNPTLNYVHFLLAALLPAVLQIIVVTTSAYSVGLDIERPLPTANFAAARRRAVAGAARASYCRTRILLPGGLRCSRTSCSSTIRRCRCGAKVRSSSWPAIALHSSCQLSGMLLVAAHSSRMATAVSIGTLLTSPAFGFMGIGFPRLGMNAFAYGWGALLARHLVSDGAHRSDRPRHAARSDPEAVLDPGWRSLSSLAVPVQRCGFERSARRPAGGRARHACADAAADAMTADPHGLSAKSSRRIFAVRPAFSVLVLPPWQSTPCSIRSPTSTRRCATCRSALVDLDGTTSSRELVRRIDATPDVAVGRQVLPDIPSAERAVYERASVNGILRRSRRISSATCCTGGPRRSRSTPMPATS